MRGGLCLWEGLCFAGWVGGLFCCFGVGFSLCGCVCVFCAGLFSGWCCFVCFQLLTLICFVCNQMPKDPNDKYWRFPDHNKWVRSRINSNSKGQIIQVIKDVLSRCGMLERFRNGPFGHYLDLPQPIVVHGMLIYNLLKNEIIHLKREDEMWFGLGQKKVCFGKEHFVCVVG